MIQDQTIGFIGGGNMARSLIGGLLQSGYDPGRLLVAEPDSACRDRLAELFDIAIHEHNRAVAEHAEVLVLAVKPQVMRSALEPIAGVIGERKPLLVSIAAGVRLNSIAGWSSPQAPIVRAMPNTPALVGSGAAALYANDLVSEVQRDTAESVLRAVGVTVWVAREEQLDTVTALSGSGPAYFFYLMEALEQAAVERGLDPAQARLLTLETAFGAAKLALESEEAPAELRLRVTSPGGTTERAIGILEDAGVRASVGDALAGAEQRSRELAALLGAD